MDQINFLGACCETGSHFPKPEVGKIRNYDCILINISEITLHVIILIDPTTVKFSLEQRLLVNV